MTGQQNFAVTLVTSENNCVHIFYTDFSLDSVHGSFATVVDKKCFSYCIEGAESTKGTESRINEGEVKSRSLLMPNLFAA